MDSIKEALTFDDVTLAPNYSEILPSQVNTSINLTPKLNINIPLFGPCMLQLKPCKTCMIYKVEKVPF